MDNNKENHQLEADYLQVDVLPNSLKYNGKKYITISVENENVDPEAAKNFLWNQPMHFYCS